MKTAFTYGLRWALWSVVIASFVGACFWLILGIIDEGFLFVFSSEGLEEFVNTVSFLGGFYLVIYIALIGFIVGFLRGRLGGSR
jgi:hypothetical protein